MLAKHPRGERGSRSQTTVRKKATYLRDKTKHYRRNQNRRVKKMHTKRKKKEYIA